MPDLVRTSLASQYVNTLHSKEEFLDIEDERGRQYRHICTGTTLR